MEINIEKAIALRDISNFRSEYESTIANDKTTPEIQEIKNGYKNTLLLSNITLIRNKYLNS